MDKQMYYLIIEKRLKFAKIYHSNPSEFNKEGLINQANKCIQLILEAKE